MEIDIEDYLDEVKTSRLERELRNRPEYKDIPSHIETKTGLLLAANIDKLSTIERVKLILKLKPYTTKAEIINEINEL